MELDDLVMAEAPWNKEISTESIYWGREEQVFYTESQLNDLFQESAVKEYGSDGYAAWKYDNLNRYDLLDRVSGVTIYDAWNLALADDPSVKTGGIDFTGQTVREWVEEHSAYDEGFPLEYLNEELKQSGILPINNELALKNAIGRYALYFSGCVMSVNVESHIDLAKVMVSLQNESPFTCSIDSDKKSIVWTADRTGAELDSMQYPCLLDMKNKVHDLLKMPDGVPKGVYLWATWPEKEGGIKDIVNNAYSAPPAAEFLDKDGDKYYIQVIDPANKTVGTSWRVIAEEDMEICMGKSISPCVVMNCDVFSPEDRISNVNTIAAPGTFTFHDSEFQTQFCEMSQETKLGALAGKLCDFGETLDTYDFNDNGTWEENYLATLADLQKGHLASYRKAINEELASGELDADLTKQANEIIHDIKEIEQKQV